MPTAYRSGINLTAALTPSLSSVSAAALSSVSARVSYTTNHAYGTVWILVNTSTTATVSEIKAGTELANAAAGAQTHDVSGLTASTTYYAHVHFEFGLESSTRHTAAFNTPATGGGGGTAYRSGITVTGPLDELVSVSDSTAGATITFETGGAYDLTVDAPTVTYGGVALTSVTVTDANTFTAVMPIDGFAFGSENDFVVTVDGVALNAISEPFLSDLGAYVTLSVGYSELHPDSPAKRAAVADLYSGLATPDQFPYDPLTAGTAAQPGGYPVSITSTGQVIITGASAEPEPLYVRFGIVDASDGYARSQDEETDEYFSTWTIYTSVPDGELTLGTVLTTDTTATVPGTWTGTNATGFQYRVGSGSWVDFATFPFVIPGLTAATAYTVDVRPVNGTVPGDIVSTSFTTGGASGVDTVPAQITFTDQAGVPISSPSNQAVVWSNSQPITDVTAGEDVSVSISGAASSLWRYSTNSGATWSTPTADAGNVRLNYLFQVGHIPASTYGAQTSTTALLGGVITDTFTTTTTTDVVAPVITLSGGNQTLTVGEDWIDPGYSATDAVDGDLTDDVVVTGTVDTDTVGSYTLTYTATDAAGNVGTAQRTVTVAASAAGLQVDSAPAEILRNVAFDVVVSEAMTAPTLDNITAVFVGASNPALQVNSVTGSGPWTINLRASSLIEIQHSNTGYPLLITVDVEDVQTEAIPFRQSAASKFVNLASVGTGTYSLAEHFTEWPLEVSHQIAYYGSLLPGGNEAFVSASGVVSYSGLLLTAATLQYRVIKPDGTLSALFTYTFEADLVTETPVYPSHRSIVWDGTNIPALVLGDTFKHRVTLRSSGEPFNVSAAEDVSVCIVSHDHQTKLNTAVSLDASTEWAFGMVTLEMDTDSTAEIAETVTAEQFAWAEIQATIAGEKYTWFGAVRLVPGHIA